MTYQMQSDMAMNVLRQANGIEVDVEDRFIVVTESAVSSAMPWASQWVSLSASDIQKLYYDHTWRYDYVKRLYHKATGQVLLILGIDRDANMIKIDTQARHTAPIAKGEKLIII